MEKCSGDKLQKANIKESLEMLAMFGSEGKGRTLVKNDKFGADFLHFQKGRGTEVHTHPGDHILYVTNGCGHLQFGKAFFVLSEGDCYFIPGSTPHKVWASSESEMSLISIANDHRAVDSEERSSLV